MSSSGSEATSTTTEMLECDPQQGVVSPDCLSEEAPYCDADGTCVSCDAIECADIGQKLSVCDEVSGLCVECSSADATACSGVTPICDEAINTCVACSEHDECGSGACNLVSGACFPNTALWVDKSKPCSGTGTEDSPFCEIGDAVDTIGSGKPTIVWVVPNKGTYIDKVSVEASRTIAIRSTTDDKVRLGVYDKDAFTASQSSLTFLDRIDIRDSDDRGIVCSGGSVWGDDVRVGKRSLGVDAMSNCSLTFRRSEIVANQAGGIQVSGGSLHLENTFVVSNGGQFSDVGGIAASSAELDITYSTLINNNAQTKGESSLGCAAGSSGEVRNSIIIGLQPDTFECPGASFEYNALDDGKLAASSNTIHESLQASWFVNAAANDFHLAAVNPFEVGLWVNGQPKTDVDGDLRPTVDETVDYVGADVP